MKTIDKITTILKKYHSAYPCDDGKEKIKDDERPIKTREARRLLEDLSILNHGYFINGRRYLFK